MYKKHKAHDPDGDELWSRLDKSKEYNKLYDASEKATKAKEARVKELSKQYIDTIKTAKISDLNLPNTDHVRKYIDGTFNDFVWDENLEFNVDHYWEPGVEKTRFKE